MTIPSTHWSKDRTSFGHNIPDDLQCKTLEEVRGDLADAGLEVSRGETQVIIPQEDAGGICVGSIVRFSNGDLVVSTWNAQMRSTDRGKSWRKVGTLFSGYACILSDGETVQFVRRDGLACEAAPPDEKSDKDGFRKSFGWLLRSRDNGLTEERAQIAIGVPEKLTLSAMSHARIVELKDGSLLGIDYARWADDPIVPFETSVSKEGIVYKRDLSKSRIFCFRSTDRGQTWIHLSMVAFDLSRNNRTTLGGFTEPDGVILPNGELLCFMRSVAGGGIRSLRMSRSNDAGRTWSMPLPVADRGVMPVATVMENGVVAVIYGRPYNWLMFSADDGDTWAGHFQFYHGPKAWDAWNYCAVEEVAPDTLLAVYGNADPDNSKLGEMLGTFFTVKRKG